jgi:hypothetical protein
MPEPIPMEKIRSALGTLHGEFEEAIHPIEAYAQVLCEANHVDVTIAHVYVGVVLEALLKGAVKQFEEAKGKAVEALGVVYEDPSKSRSSIHNPDHPYFERMLSAFHDDDETWKKIKAVLQEEESAGEPAKPEDEETE